MKQSFLIFLVAFLFCCTGCTTRKKISRIKNKQSQKTQNVVQKQAKDALIKRSSDRLIQASRLKNKDEESFTMISVPTSSRVFESSSLKKRIAEIEARFGDVPVPLMVKGVVAYNEGQGRYALVYETFLSLDELTYFYEGEMGRLGWVKITSFAQGERLFSFKKQKQSCIISIRSSKKSWWGKKSTELHIYLQI